MSEIKIKKRVTVTGLDTAIKRAIAKPKTKIEQANELKKNTLTPAQIKKNTDKEIAKLQKDATTQATQIKADAERNLSQKENERDTKRERLDALNNDLADANGKKTRALLINGLLKTSRSFSRTWKDSGSGATLSATFYHVKPSSGYLSLGDTGYPSYGKPQSSFKVMTLKKNNGVIRYKYPVKYVRVWKDSGSGASWDGAFWKAIPPKGYVAMGMMSTRGYKAPSTRAMVCVEARFTKTAKVSQQLWNDKRSGAHTDVSAWFNSQLGTFWAHTSHNKPGGNVIRVFDLNKIRAALD